MQKILNLSDTVQTDNLTAVFRMEMQKLRKQLNKKKSFVCRYCGKQAPKPHGGKCPYSPYKNKCHEFIEG